MIAQLAQVSDGVTLGLMVFVGGLAATGSPILLAAITNRYNRRTKEQEWARQDLLAARAEKAAADQLAIQHAVEEGVKAANAKLAEVAEVAKVTHALVNSDKTSAMKEKRDSMARLLLITRELAELHASLGHAPSADLLASMARDQANLEALDAAIVDRLEQQALAEAQIALAKERQEKPGP